MGTAVYVVMLLFLLVIATGYINIKELDRRINKVIAEEIRQNKRIDLLEKLEQIRQSEQCRDKAYIEARDLFKEW